ncbi:hypothetical protein Nmel_000986, partial [Mimus melanotis]
KIDPAGALPSKKPGARHLCFLPGLSPLQTHISLPLSHLCSSHISGDGEVPLKRSDGSDHKCLKEPEISVERQVATGQTSRTCRKLGPTASEGRKVERWGLAFWEVRRLKVKQ